MVITDLNGEIIEVPDLQLALMQADDYRHIRSSDPGLAGLDEYLRRYWRTGISNCWL